jgi:2-polyprenyl-3-methyl-5-hydroxy-6-metoxy-1,4-benzoquinol methylase
MEQMLEWMDEGGYEYVRCPDATCKFSLGQAISMSAIDRARSRIAALPPDQKNFYSSRPFAFMRSHPDDFRVGLFEPFPSYDEQTLREMRKIASGIYIEERAIHTEHACAVGDVSRRRYESMLEFVKGDMAVLDIACGTGYGSRMLSAHARNVIGVDISSEAIDFAKAHHNSVAEFRLGNAETIPLDSDEVDLAFSIATIEHVEDDDAFVAELARVIRPGGKIIVYTPQNRFGKLPIWPWHVREYSAAWLRSVVAPHFKVEAIWGWQNGVVTPDDERGDGMYLIASKV